MAADQPISILNHLRRSVGGPVAPGVPDAELLERFVRLHDEAAFELLVWRHERMVWGLCRRVLHDTADAEDAFQAAFLVLARKAPAIGRRESVAAWLHQVAYRCALKLRTVLARQPRSAADADLATLAAAEPSMTAAERRDLWRVLDEEVQRLPAKYRAAVVLCYLEGKTYQEAAEQLGCPLGTLSARLTTARERLHGRLTARGVTLTAALMATVLCEQAARAGAAAALINQAIQATRLTTATALAASRASNLADGVMKTMSMSKLKIGVVVVVAASFLGLAGAVASHALRSDKRADEAAPPVRAEGVPAWQPCATLGGAVGSARFTRFSPDSKTLLTVTEKGLYQLWDTTTWELRGQHDPLPHYRAADTLLGQPFSPDGRLLALCGQIADPDKPVKTISEITFLDAKTAKLVKRLAGAGPNYSPDKTSFVTWHADRVTVWDAKTFEKKFDLQVAAEVRGLEIAFAKDGSLLFAPTKSGTGHLWDLKSGEELAKLDGSLPSFAADGKTLLTHLPSGVVKLWDPATGKERAALSPAEQSGYWAEFTDDGKHILTVATSFLLKPNGDPDIRQLNKPVKPKIRPLELRLWDTQGKELVHFPGQDRFSAYARPSPDGKLVGYLRLEPNETERQELVLWDVAANKQRCVIRTNKGVHWFEFSPDGGAVFTRDPELADLKIWDTATGRRLPDLMTSIALYDIHFSPDGKLLTATAGSLFQPKGGPADVYVFRLSDRLLPPPVKQGEPSKTPEPPAPVEEPKRTKSAQALADLDKESRADVAAFFKKIETAKTDADRQALLQKQLETAQRTFIVRAIQIARDDIRDPAAVEALNFALRHTMGGYGAEDVKLRGQVFDLIRTEFFKIGPDLSILLPSIRYQRTGSADELLQTLALRYSVRAVRGRAAYQLAESLSEQADMARLLHVMPEVLKHPAVQDKIESLAALAKADPEAIARKAEQWWTRVKDQYADVSVSNDSEKTLGAEAEHGLFALCNLAIGKTAPDIEGDDLDGQKFKLSDYRGKVVVLIFCGNWCGPCREMNPHKQQLVERHANQPFAMLEVNSDDDPEAVKRTMRKEKLTWRCWFDGGRDGPVAKQWHVQSWPTIVVVDGKGVIRYKELRADLLNKAVETLLAETKK